MLTRSLAASLLLGAVAFGQTNPATPPWSTAVTPSAKYVFDTDAGDANFSVFRSGVGVTTGGPWSDSVFAKLAVEGEYAAYDFDGLDNFGLADSDGPDDLIFIDLRPSLAVYLNPDFGLYGGVIVGVGAETSADFGDAFYYGGFVGFNYQVSPGVWIGTGVGATTQLEDSALVVPLFTLDWQLDDRWNLSATGLGGKLSYKIDENWTAFLEGRYEFREYRLGGSSVIPDGVLTDESVPLGLGVTYAADQNLSLTLAGGAIVWRSLELADSDGDNVVDEDADVTGYVSVSLKWSF
jgi:long-subunit fatty acid transport protein